LPHPRDLGSFKEKKGILSTGGRFSGKGEKGNRNKESMLRGKVNDANKKKKGVWYDYPGNIIKANFHAPLPRYGQWQRNATKP